MRLNVPIAEQVAAVRLAVREALRDHALHGNPVCVMRDGELVWLTPEETFAELRRLEAEAARQDQVPNG